MTSRKRKIRWVISGIIVLSGLTWLASKSIQENIVYFYTPSEALALDKNKIHSTMRIGGLVKAGSKAYQGDSLDLEFILTDQHAANINIKYHGIPPDMFKEGQGVVVEGRFLQAEKSMIAHKLMVKHSEEYRAPHDPVRMDQELIQRSLMHGNQNGSP